MSAGNGDGEGDGDDGPGTREVARRVFAAEYDDATLSYSESDEERAPTYVVTPSGAKANRLFLTGVLTEVEDVNEEMVRARIVDPTGPFVVYAGQYQPDERAFFERADPPEFVAVSGKARTFSPEDGDRVFSSVRPESVNAVDADVRDRWVVDAAARTLERVATAARALRDGDDPTAGLDPTSGVALALDHYGTRGAYLTALRDLAVDAAAVVAGDRDEVRPLAADPDDPGPADLAALADLDADLAVGREAGDDRSAAEATASTTTTTGTTGATAGGTGEAGADADTGDSGEASTGGSTVESESTTKVGSTAGSGSVGDAGSTADGSTADGSAETDSSVDVGSADSGSTAEVDAGSGVDADAGESDAAGEVGETDATDATGSVDSTGDDRIGDFEGGDLGADSGDSGSTVEDFDAGEDDRIGDFESDLSGDAGSEENDDAGGFDDGGDPAVETDEMYELDEEERREIESEYSTEFSTATEVDSPGDGPEPDDAGSVAVESTGDADATGATPDSGSDPEDADGVPSGDDEDADTGVDDATGEDSAAAAADEDGDDADAGDVDLDAMVVDRMQDLDDGSGADREQLVAAIVDETGADPGAVEDAIQSALMGGQCYEPEEGRLKPI